MTTFDSFNIDATVLELIKKISPEEALEIHNLYSRILFYDSLVFAIKLYTLLLYTKITFDQLPLFNPYLWPFSVLRYVTVPYLRIWEKLFPRLRLGPINLDISVIIALEVLGWADTVLINLGYNTMIVLENQVIQLCRIYHFNPIINF